MNTTTTKKTNRTAKVLFWVSTTIIFLFEGVMPAFTSQTEMAKQAMSHLQYPAYFGIALVIFKVIGTIILMIPKLPARIKEWAYAGFTFDFLFASISNTVVDGFGAGTFFPLVILGILAVSYFYYHKLKNAPSWSNGKL
jgi:hypothetical protein